MKPCSYGPLSSSPIVGRPRLANAALWGIPKIEHVSMIEKPDVYLLPGVTRVSD